MRMILEEYGAEVQGTYTIAFAYDQIWGRIRCVASYFLFYLNCDVMNIHCMYND